MPTFAFSRLLSYLARTVAGNTAVHDRTSKLFLKLSKITRGKSPSISPDAVHDLRTTARRVETLLSTRGLTDHDGTSKLARQLAKLRRGAGKLRDIDVHIAALQSIRLENGARDKGVLHDHLTKLRSKREEKLLRTIDKQAAKGLAKRMKRAAKSLKSQSGDEPARDYAAEALARFKALADGCPQLTEKTLHDFRIECKRIRYLAEMSPESPDAEQVTSSLKQIQDVIGEWHDWLTLTDTAKSLISSRTSGLVAALRAHTRSRYNEALRVTAETRRDLLTLAEAASPATPPRRGPASSPLDGSEDVRAAASLRSSDNKMSAA